MSEDEIVYIGDNYASIADKMQEVVHDAMSYDGYIIGEFEKLKRMGTLSELQGEVYKTLHIT